MTQPIDKTRDPFERTQRFKSRYEEEQDKLMGLQQDTIRDTMALVYIDKLIAYISVSRNHDIFETSESISLLANCRNMILAEYVIKWGFPLYGTYYRLYDLTKERF